MNAFGDELRMLRERAYGPSADIHDDPQALARLHELEAAEALAARAGAETANAQDAAAPASADPIAPEVESGADAGSASDADPAPGAGATPDEAREHAADGAPRAPARAGLSRRVRWLWAGSVVAALIAGAAVTLAAPSLGSGRVAVLAEADESEWPAEMFGEAQEGSRIFEPFHGMRALVVPNAWGNPDAGVSCIFVAVEREADPDLPASEILTTGCGDAVFPPTASFTVTELSPLQLRERFPPGTALRVVLEGDEVHVFERASFAPAATP